MDKTINKMIVNSVEYTIPKITFAVGSQLEELGFNFLDMKAKMLTNVIAFISFVTKKDGGELLELHCDNGGKIIELFNIMTKVITESAFFRNLAE